MTGPEHYAEAERLIADVVEGDGTPSLYANETPGWIACTIAIAQVHATLALAAATAYPTIVAPGGVLPTDRVTAP